MKRKNFRETQPLLGCVRATLHHCNWGPIEFAPNQAAHVHGKQRIESVNDGLIAILWKIHEIEKYAKEKGDKELLKILNEPVEFGLDENGRKPEKKKA